MESKIRETAPSTWLSSGFSSWRIGSDARNFEFIQKPVGAGAKPARVSRLKRDTAVKPLSQHGAERASNAGIECKTRRQLHEKATRTRTQRRQVREECSN